MKGMKKLIEKEKNRMSKKQKKELADMNWVGKGTLRPARVIESKRQKSLAHHKGRLASDIRNGYFD